MPIIKPDTSKAVEFTTIEPGTYKARIESVEYKTSKSGNPMIVPKFKVLVGDKEYTRNAYLVISGEGSDGFNKLLRASGFDAIADKFADKSIAEADKPEFDTDDLVGQEVNVVITHRLFEGEMRDQIQTYLKA